ncbi:hypothetical protein P7H50_12950 [Enterococcus durans]|nr:hypothetical protein [Enterococcus durans]
MKKEILSSVKMNSEHFDLFTQIKRIVTVILPSILGTVETLFARIM